MARFELSIREPGKPPRTVPLTKTIVIGRSRRADVTIEDEEVGREQFRIGVDRGTVVVEGIGKTNRTMIDGTVLDPGVRMPLSTGAVILVGRTSFVLQAEDSTQVSGRPGPPEAPAVTMVKPGPPGRPGSSPPTNDSSGPLGPEEQTGGAEGPMQTLQMPRPGSPSLGPPSPGAAPGPAPGSSPPAAAPPPSPPPAEGALDQTMQWQGGFRPGAAGPARPESKPPVPPAAVPPAAARPAPAPPPPARTAPPAPAMPPPSPVAAPAPTPPAKVSRPTTVALSQSDLQEADLLGGSAKVLDLETRLQEAAARLFVKSDTIRRRIPLLVLRCTIGRAATCDAELPADSVSELHAEIVFDGTTFTLRDSGSKNGTWVDGTCLRSTTQALARHSLIGFGNLRAIFLCNDRRTAARDRRIEQRALRLLIASGRLQNAEGQQILQMARSEPSQSIAEILLMETQLAATDWAAAITTARSQKTWFDRLRELGARFVPGKTPPPAR